MKPGQVVGYAGATGYVIPPGAVNLHFEPRKNGGAYLLEPMSAVTSFGQWGTGGASCSSQGTSPYWYGIPSRADISTFYAPETNRGILHTFLSNGSSAFAFQTPYWYDSGSGSYTLSQVQGRMVTGDFTGDGRRDIATFYGSGSSATIHVWKSTGSAFVFQSAMTWSSSTFTLAQVADRMIAGDFNGDGFDDIAVFYQNGDGSTAAIHVWTAASNGTALSYAGTWFSGTYSLSQVANRFVAADFNRDGRSDIATFYSTGTNSARIDVWLSSGSNFGSRLTWFTSPSYALSVVGDRFVAGDFNGDGRTDLASFYQSGSSGLIHMWTSTGSGLAWGGTWSTNSSYTLSNVAGRMVAGDWTGLGYDDVATFYSTGTGSARTDAWLSSGSTFGLKQIWFSSGSYTLGVVGDRMVGGDFDDR